MDWVNTLAFVVYPYLALTTFVVGHSYRYTMDLYLWSSHSTELLQKEGHYIPITLWHWGILVTLFGHAGGLLIPQWFLDIFGLNAQIHTFLAISIGMVAGTVAVLGLVLLLVRRLSVRRLRVVSSVNDWVLLGLLLFTVSAGTYNVFFEHYAAEALYTIAPWIRSIVTLAPDPSLIAPAPWSYKIHILAALTVLGFSPFTRLVHIWSVPIPYLFRRFIVFRRRELRVS